MNEVKLFKSIRDVDPTAWNSIVGRDRLICRHEYLAAVEASCINECRFFYPVIYDAKGVAAHACFYFIRTDLDALCRGWPRRVIEWVRKAWRDFLVLRSVECGTPVALGNTVSCRADVNLPEVLERIAVAAEGLAAELGVGVILFRDFEAGELALWRGLRQRGYRLVTNLPTARLCVRWRSFDEYVASLRSRYKRRIRIDLRRFQAAGLTVETVREFADHAPELARLWRNVYDQASEYRREVLRPEFFANMSRELRGQAAVILMRQAATPVAFALVLLDDETLIPLFLGLDYRHSREGGVLFNLYYRVIEMAILTGKTAVDFGITTLTQKARLGAEVVPLYMYMKHLNPALNAVVPRAFAALSPHAYQAQRDAFRQ